MSANSRWLVRIALGALLIAATGAAPPPPSDICPVHGIKMETVALRMVYGMPSPREFEEMRIAKARFPFGRDSVLGGCVLKPTKTVRGFLCSRCVEARKAWLEQGNH